VLSAAGWELDPCPQELLCGMHPRHDRGGFLRVGTPEPCELGRGARTVGPIRERRWPDGVSGRRLPLRRQASQDADDRERDTCHARQGSSAVLSWTAMPRRRKVEHCPECGTEFRQGRKACPECGSDAQTGWKSEEEIQYQSVQIPDTYEQLVGEVPPKRNLRSIIYTLAAILALLGMLLWVFTR
jgi:hypothetical protein